MKLLKKSQPQPEAPEVGPSLQERIQQIMDEAGAILEAEAQRRKATPDGQGLPIDWIRANARSLSGGNCNCKCALRILEKKG
jgi:hypothetical protein